MATEVVSSVIRCGCFVIRCGFVISVSPCMICLPKFIIHHNRLKFKLGDDGKHNTMSHLKMTHPAMNKSKKEWYNRGCVGRVWKEEDTYL